MTLFCLRCAHDTIHALRVGHTCSPHAVIMHACMHTYIRKRIMLFYKQDTRNSDTVGVALSLSHSLSVSLSLSDSLCLSLSPPRSSFTHCCLSSTAVFECWMPFTDCCVRFIFSLHEPSLPFPDRSEDDVHEAMQRLMLTIAPYMPVEPPGQRMNASPLT